TLRAYQLVPGDASGKLIYHNRTYDTIGHTTFYDVRHIKAQTYLWPEWLKSVKLNRIKEVLAEKGKTQVWLAEQLDLDFQTVNRWCNQRKQPSLEYIFEVARLLKVSPRELIKEP